MQHHNPVSNSPARTRRAGYCILAALLVPLLAKSASFPVGMRTDSRVQVVAYHPAQVYEITTAYGIATTVEFAPGENVVSAAFGDAAAWHFVELPNSFNIKPVMWDANTNLTVWTTARLYLFNLSVLPPAIDAAGDIQKPSHNDDLLYLLRFTYPTEAHDFREMKGTLDWDQWLDNRPPCTNYHYTRYGAASIAPTRVCDDGRFTYLAFDRTQNQPAVFWVDSKRREHVVNTRQYGNNLVVERLGKQFSLRYGDEIATVFNESPPRP